MENNANVPGDLKKPANVQKNTETKVNVRGGINALEVNQSMTLPKGVYKPSVVRASAACITGDTGKVFTVSADDGEKVITVTRIA